MAERLTIKNSDNTYSQPTDTTFEMVFNKLGELEDIMEKYNIEDLEQLDIMLFCLSSETKFQLKQLQKLYKKYNIKNVEEFEQELKIAHEIERLKDKNIDLNNAIIVFDKNFIKDYIREIDKLKAVSDTWQKACELACEREDDCYVYDNIHRAYEFYQQAKKEGDDE